MSVYLLSICRTSPCLGAGLEPGGFLPGSLAASWAACSGASGGMAAFTAGRLKKLSYRVSTRGLYVVAGAAAPFAGAPKLVRAAAEEGSLSSLAICMTSAPHVRRVVQDVCMDGWSVDHVRIISAQNRPIPDEQYCSVSTSPCQHTVPTLTSTYLDIHL